MYNFVRTERGWKLYWGPLPRGMENQLARSEPARLLQSKPRRDVLGLPRPTARMGKMVHEETETVVP